MLAPEIPPPPPLDHLYAKFEDTPGYLVLPLCELFDGDLAHSSPTGGFVFLNAKDKRKAVLSERNFIASLKVGLQDWGNIQAWLIQKKDEEAGDSLVEFIQQFSE